MKLSEVWLREWVRTPRSGDALAQQLTMAGLEVDGVEPVRAEFEGVVVGEIVEVGPHPNADKLRLCTVAAGFREPLPVVCGAPNVRVGLKSALAIIGARLPGGMQIRKARLRGVESRGMLCSLSELGIDGEASGIMELPADAPVGQALEDYLQLADTVIDVDLTPNRGDCFSVLGIARELAALEDAPLSGPPIEPVASVVDDVFPVSIEAETACPRFVGRVIRNVPTGADSPAWMVERLRRAGVRAIHPVVDVTNYVMLELGQPLHAYDLARLEDRITVRFARQGEPLTLLDGREIELDPDVLVIADGSGAIGLAGIMGGEGTGVDEKTVDIVFESAFFAPSAISGRARRYGLHTDASVRFERGVDPAHQARAVERATRLLLEIAGGEPGPLVVTEAPDELPAREPVKLRAARLARLLGVELPGGAVADILERLGMAVETTAEGWTVTPPSHRFDIEREVDLIEEVARIHGYDAIPREPERAAVRLSGYTEAEVSEARVRHCLVDRGYHEAVTYSFVDEALQRRFFPETDPVRLSNPIASDMGVMRRSLWPGLVLAARENLARQHERVRLFEIGAQFQRLGRDVWERPAVAGVVVGDRWPEQWGEPSRPVDLFDVKADVEALLALGARGDEFVFRAGSHVALSPGQTLKVVVDGAIVGWVGALHPQLAGAVELERTAYLFALDAEAVTGARVPRYQGISRFPSVRRDIAVVVEESVPAGQLLDLARAAGGQLLKDVVLFDVYRGEKIDSGNKSMALGLILQDSSRTLTDAIADQVVDAVVARLRDALGARIRD